MADSPAEAILDALVTQLSGANVDLTGVTGAPDIPAGNIIVTTVPYEKDARQRFAKSIPRPALVINTCRATNIDPSAGDTCKYVAMYTFLIQIVHTELDLKNTAITRSIQKWEYQIHNYLHMGNLRQAADEAGEWYVTLVPFGKVDHRDERMFAILDDAVSLIAFQVKSTEAHNPAGRT
jgi:hypothetical protein